MNDLGSLTNNDTHSAINMDELEEIKVQALVLKNNLNKLHLSQLYLKRTFFCYELSFEVQSVPGLPRFQKNSSEKDIKNSLFC